MPNLNKIRGHNRGGLGSSSIGRGLGSQPQRPMYGALSKQHNSDPRLICLNNLFFIFFVKK